MQANIFDDKRSIVHTILGAISLFIPQLFILFFLYEFIEHMIKNGEEPVANFLGDMFEFFIGTGGCALILNHLC